jgi:hypothetical protein
MRTIVIRIVKLVLNFSHDFNFIDLAKRERCRLYRLRSYGYLIFFPRLLRRLRPPNRNGRDIPGKYQFRAYGYKRRNK